MDYLNNFNDSYNGFLKGYVYVCGLGSKLCFIFDKIYTMTQEERVHLKEKMSSQ